MSNLPFVSVLTPEIEERLSKNPLLNIDTFIVPSPFVKEADIEKDYAHSYVWIVEGEVLGYILVYADAKNKNYHIYKIVTSPFGRGKGIGTTFIEHLADAVPPGSTLYLYVWNKQVDTIDFFVKKGFTVGESMVYRNLLYYHLFAAKEEIVRRERADSGDGSSAVEEISKTRHDARKTVNLLSNMIDTLTPETCNKIIEDVNRETTGLINMLNSLRTSVDIIHGVNLQDMLTERIVPYVKASGVACELRLSLDATDPVVLGYYENVGRALVNLVANALDAIQEAKRKGVLEIGLKETGESIVIRISDNGVGIPEELLSIGPDGLPQLVGRSTKKRVAGEGMGTKQIYSTFGRENISISSVPWEGTSWRITCKKAGEGIDKIFIRLERRFNEFLDLWEQSEPSVGEDRTRVIAYIWQIRAMEIFLFDVILQFSSYHNIRTIYRTVLSYLRGFSDDESFKNNVYSYRCDYERLPDWLFEVAREIKNRLDRLAIAVDIADFRGAMFKSYGQAVNNIIVFTMDPETGDFLSADRKLAEHQDFVHYLNKDRDSLLRGEMKGDANSDDKPIFLGVWSMTTRDDALAKLELIKKGASALLDMGLHPSKRLSFYQTTYVGGDNDIDTYQTPTIGEMAAMESEDLGNLLSEGESEMQGFIVTD